MDPYKTTLKPNAEPYYNGIKADPEKRCAVINFSTPGNITDLQRFNSMVSQLGKFIPTLAEINLPLQSWLWGPAQEEAFQGIKDALLEPHTLAHYDTSKPTVITAGVCKSGIGAVMLQIQEDGNRQPVGFASRSLTNAELEYAVIEKKKTLAVTWACEKFAQYVAGMDFTVETDHKPLVSLLSSKDLSPMLKRIFQFRMRIMRFSPKIEYVQRKYQVTAHALSRATIGSQDVDEVMFVEEVEDFTKETLKFIPASMQKLKEISEAQDADEDCAEVKQLCRDGWPAYLHDSPYLQPYFEKRAHLTLHKGLLIYDDRIVIPKTMRLEMLNKIRQGHLGIPKCHARAREAVWWPGISSSSRQQSWLSGRAQNSQAVDQSSRLKQL